MKQGCQCTQVTSVKNPGLSNVYCFQILFVLALITFGGCKSVAPLTPASQFASLDQKSINLWVQADQGEAQVAAQLEKYPELQPVNDYLKDVLARIVPEFFEETSQIELRVAALPDTSANACALPNGAIYINSGMLSLLENEAQLAAILSHEAMHFIHRHSRESTYEQFINVLLDGVYSKQQELDADSYGYQAARQAGYDVNEIPRAFDLILKSEGEEVGGSRTMFSSHPKLKTRIKNYNRLINQKQDDTLPGGHFKGLSEYEQHICGALIVNAKLNVESLEEEKALVDLDQHLAIDSNSAEVFYWKGRAEQKLNVPSHYQLAIDSYQEALARDPNHYAAHREIGLAYRYTNDPNLFVSHIEQFINLAPPSAEKSILSALIQNDETFLPEEDSFPFVKRTPLDLQSIEAREFFRTVELVGLIPCTIGFGVNEPEQKLHVIEEAIEAYFDRENVSYISSACFKQMYQAMLNHVKTENPLGTMSLQDQRLIYNLAKSEYLFYYHVDALIRPTIIPVLADFELLTASWHGKSQGVYTNAVLPTLALLGGTMAHGRTEACSLRISIENGIDDVYDTQYGGIELLKKLDSLNRFVSVSKDQLLTNTELLVKSVSLALKAYFK